MSDHLRALIDGNSHGRSDAQLERDAGLGTGTVRNYAPQVGHRRSQILPPPDFVERLAGALMVPTTDVLNAAAADLGIVARMTSQQCRACDALGMLPLDEQAQVADMIVTTVMMLLGVSSRPTPPPSRRRPARPVDGERAEPG